MHVQLHAQSKNPSRLPLSLSLRVFSLRSRCYNLFWILYPLNKLGLEFIMRICDYIFEYAYHTLSNIEQHSKWVEILLFRLNWQNLNGKKTKTWKKITKDLDFLASNLYFIHSTKYGVKWIPNHTAKTNTKGTIIEGEFHRAENQEC